MALTLGLLAACAVAAPPRPAPVQLEAAATRAGYRLSLIPAPGARINARLKPVLELTDGTRLQFDAPALTADSGYFAEPPVIGLERRPGRLRGLLRVGVCPAGLNVCESLALPVDQPLPPG